MWEFLLNFVKKYALWGIITLALSLLGGAFVNLIHWEFLVSFFSIIIHLIDIFDFWVNIPLLIDLLGIVLIMESAYWIFYGVFWAVVFFYGRD